LKIVKNVPVGEESHAFMISKYVYAVRSLYYTCFLPPSYAANLVEVFHAIRVHASYASSTGFLDVITLHELVCLFRYWVESVADHYSS